MGITNIAFNPCDKSYCQQINRDHMRDLENALNSSPHVDEAVLMDTADSVKQARMYTSNATLAQFAMFFIRSNRQLIKSMIGNHAEIWRLCGHGEKLPESLLNRSREIMFFLNRRCKLDLTISEGGFLAVVYGFHEPMPKEYLCEEDVIGLVARYLGVVLRNRENQITIQQSA